MSQARRLFTGNAFEFEVKSPSGKALGVFQWFYVALCFCSSIFLDSGLRQFEELTVSVCSMVKNCCSFYFLLFCWIT